MGKKFKFRIEFMGYYRGNNTNIIRTKSIIVDDWRRKWVDDGGVKSKRKWQMTDGMKSGVAADKQFQLRRGRKGKKWKRSERVCGREREV